MNDVRRRESVIFAAPSSLPGIDLRTTEQLGLVRDLAQYHSDMPFPEQQQASTRFYLDNDFFTYGDAIVLYAMLRRYRPQRVVEVGSGHSSALILDVNDRFFDGKIECTFIEPYPARLQSLLLGHNGATAEIIAAPLQDVTFERFEALEPGDILFIDSTHVAKVGSDVNLLLFDVLPRLRPGVLIHFHDIFYPFEYPRKWIYEGRAWNECYILRAFLTNNRGYDILLFNSYLAQFHHETVTQNLPLWSKDPGASIWIERMADLTPHLPSSESPE